MLQLVIIKYPSNNSTMKKLLRAPGLTWFLLIIVALIFYKYRYNINKNYTSP